MNFRRILVVTMIVVGGGLSIPAEWPQAQEGPPPDPRYQNVPAALLVLLSRAPSEEEFISRLLQSFRGAVGRDGVLTRDDVAEIEAKQTAGRRAQGIATVLANDLNGDGNVTRDEVQRAAQSQLRDNDEADAATMTAQIDKMIGRAMLADTNGDDIISFDEVMSQANRTAATESGGAGEDRAGMLMYFDADGDDKVGLPELRAEGRKLYALADIDGDALLGAEGRRDLQAQAQQRNRALQLKQQLAACDFPLPTADQQIMALKVGRGIETPRVSIAGLDDTSWSASIGIEPGAAPLWMIVMSSDPMLWRIEGDSARIAQMIVVPGQRNDMPMGGVMGLPREKIHFVDSTTCGLSRAASGNKKRVADALTTLLGRAPDSLALADVFYSVTFPGGIVAPRPGLSAKPEGVSDRVWHDAFLAGAGRVVEMAPTDVVATAKAETYEVLPEKVGLIQLIADGSIQPRLAGSYISFDIKTPELIARRLDGYVYEIVKPIKRFPPGLYGANAVTFALAKDVPMPAGNPGHSCVIDGVTGKVLLGGGRCAGD